MEDILELVFSVAVEIVKVIKFKNPKIRKRILTTIFSLVFVIPLGLSVWGVVTLLQQGSLAGAIVMGIIALATLVIGLDVIVRDHNTNWIKY